MVYLKTVMDNGITVVTEEIPFFNSASIGIWLNVGSINEDKVNNGISHFIEHMMFKGTNTRSAKDIAEKMDGIGGYLNAFTEKEHTCYYARIMDKYVEFSMEVLSDMLLNSVFDKQEMLKEKGVVLDEIRLYEDAPDEMVFDLFTEHVLAGHPLGQSTLGKQEVVQSLNSKMIKDFISRFYIPENIVISAAGHIKHNEILEYIKKYFSKMDGTRKRKKIPEIKNSFGQIIQYKDCEQVYVCMGLPGTSQRDPDRYKVTVLDSILGGSMSSRLFQEIRETRGLVYSVCTFQNAYADSGLFGIFAGTSAKNVDEVISLVYEILSNIRKTGITEEELVRSKEHIKGTIALAMESTTNRMIRLAKSEIFHGRLISHEEVIEKIDKVTIEDVYEMCQTLAQPDKYSVALLGPVDKDKNYLCKNLVTI